MRCWRLFLPALALAGQAFGCSSSPQAEPSKPEQSFQPLVSLDDFTAVERSADPFVTDPDLTPTCLGSGFFNEETYIEIDTGECSWVTLAAPARFDVSERSELRLVVSHYDLTAVQPAQAELRLWLGECEAWSECYPIPGAADLYTETFASPCALDQGDLVQFHLHNHGQNNWQLRELSIKR